MNRIVLFIFVLRNTTELRLKFVDSYFYPPPLSPVVYAADLSKAVVPVLFLFCMALWFTLWGVSCFEVSTCSLSSFVVIPFSIVITSLGEEGAGLCASRAMFVCFVRVRFCRFSLSFSLPLGVRGWLRFVTVAIPELFYYFFFFVRAKTRFKPPSPTPI